MTERSHRAVRRGVAPTTGCRLGVMVAVLAASLAVSAVRPATAVQEHGTGDTVRQGLQHLVHDDRFPAALAATTDRDGRTHHYAAGVADLRTGARVPLDGQVRAGSNTKPFTATVVLQLVGEGKIALDAPVERYLPGLVRGKGNDGRRITVRQLLQHTSGLPNYTEFLGDIPAHRHRYVQPRTLLDLALAHQPLFAPGTNWSYSNTNYVLAGLLVEKVTGRPLAEQITRRVIDRIGLRHTYFPGVGDERLRAPHPEGYFPVRPGGSLTDVTELDPGWAWAAGQLVSTPGDLNRFFRALFGGELLAPAQLAQMRTTVPAASGLWPGARYGLGVISTPLSCGGRMWGHGGDIPGYRTRSGVTDDGRALTVAVTADPTPTKDAPDHAQALLDTALCR
ncbi:serine hydrolase domain-containing protein [Streptomyces sp. WZ-12]|uniref:serine hydrolase domain-containing protein n=1 Tax=Streptomyces sp. WZ-12 TaxID=3030210 RepID=UPI0023811B3D|nr:serine hydrolase domain-containing protein [Streptomyces sp. WZ-12]